MKDVHSASVLLPAKSLPSMKLRHMPSVEKLAQPSASCSLVSSKTRVVIMRRQSKILIQFFRGFDRHHHSEFVH